MNWQQTTALIAGISVLFGVSLNTTQAQTGGGALLESGGDAIGLPAFSLLPSGTKLALGPDQSLTVSYPASCSVETITGGTVTIGDRASTVAGGRVEREEINCTPQAVVVDQDTAIPGGVLIRSDGQWQRPLLYSVSPLIILSVQMNQYLEIKDDTDKAVFSATAEQSGLWAVDTAQRGLRLNPGIYKAALDNHTIADFEITPQASQSAQGVSRLVLITK